MLKTLLGGARTTIKKYFLFFEIFPKNMVFWASKRTPSVRPSIRQYKRPRRLVPRGWSLDVLEKLNKIPKVLSTDYKEAGKAWAQYVQDKTQYVQD